MLLGCVALHRGRGAGGTARRRSSRPASAGGLDHRLARHGLRRRLRRPRRHRPAHAHQRNRDRHGPPAVATRTPKAATRNAGLQDSILHRGRRPTVAAAASAATPNGTSIPKWWNHVTGSARAERTGPVGSFRSMRPLTTSALTTATASAPTTTARAGSARSRSHRARGPAQSARRTKVSHVEEIDNRARTKHRQVVRPRPSPSDQQAKRDGDEPDNGSDQCD